MGTAVSVGAGASVGIIVAVGSVAEVGVGAKVAVAAGAGAGDEVAEAPQPTANNISKAANPVIKLLPFLCPVRNRFIESLALARCNPAEVMFMPGYGSMLYYRNPWLFK